MTLQKYIRFQRLNFVQSQNKAPSWFGTKFPYLEQSFKGRSWRLVTFKIVWYNTAPLAFTWFPRDFFVERNTSEQSKYFRDFRNLKKTLFQNSVPRKPPKSRFSLNSALSGAKPGPFSKKQKRCASGFKSLLAQHNDAIIEEPHQHVEINCIQASRLEIDVGTKLFFDNYFSSKSNFGWRIYFFKCFFIIFEVLRYDGWTLTLLDVLKVGSAISTKSYKK